ncbi:hypothetical protein GRS96_06980 [Rathayibacter sp. VKM Ac-2803]|uniref:hypothetical protein n=1 Tax=Rathayibacter sp. VKM Ac-2803 TaxID=2609256 RepID=UPI00135C8326|nr:hypothetical protein [Rathayibacter sp. VKM Ac-2803]MWV49021.1 hypothetical protein [Rathayibacter sp. VKM Ac-2803]
MSRQRRRTAASSVVLAVLLATLALPSAAQAGELVPSDPASSVLTEPVGPIQEEQPTEPPVEEPPVVVPPIEEEPPAQPPVEEPPVVVPPIEEEPPAQPPVEEPPVVVPPIEEEPTAPTQPTQPQQPSQPNQPAQPNQPDQPAQPSSGTGGNGGTTGGGTTGGGSTGGNGGSTGGTATTEAGSAPPRASAPGRTLLSTSAADPAAAPAPAAEGQPATEASTPAVSVYLTRDAGVDPGALTVDLARFYGVGVAYAGFQREETATASLRAPAGTETALTVTREDGAAFSTGSATVPAAALAAIGAYSVTMTGDRGSSATTTFSLVSSSGPGVLVEPRQVSGEQAEAPRGAVWGFGPVESVALAAYTTAGKRADLAAGDLAVRVDALGWSDLALGDSVVKDPTAELYCIVAVGSVSGRTAAVTVAYPEGASAAEVPEASQVCGIAITAAKTGLTSVPSTEGTGGLSAGVGLTIGAGVLVAALVAGLVTAVVLRRRRENDDLLIGGPLPHPTEE